MNYLKCLRFAYSFYILISASDRLRGSYGTDSLQDPESGKSTLPRKRQLNAAFSERGRRAASPVSESPSEHKGSARVSGRLERKAFPRREFGMTENPITARKLFGMTEKYSCHAELKKTDR